MANANRPPDSPDYFIKRESQERTLAERAKDRAARNAHLTMAARYAALVREQMPQQAAQQPA